MDIYIHIILAIVILALTSILIINTLKYRKGTPTNLEMLEQKLLFALASKNSIIDIQNTLKGLPRDLMQSITGSLSQRTGKLNELMATFELTQYDRLFYLGEPVDFIGIKYGESIDFIEVKTGRFRLTEDETKLKNLVELKKVHYVPLSVERINIAEEVNIEKQTDR